MPRKLRVFLCHASEDKPAVRELYKRLAAEPWIEPWLDEESLLPGQDFDLEIYKATRDADTIIICLSKVSVAKEGYVNKEIRRAYDIALEKPEGTIYVIPLRLDECNPSFEYLRKLHWVDYFKPNAHEKLVKALRLRVDNLEIEINEKTVDIPAATSTADVDLDLYRFIQIPPTERVPYSFYIGKYPVTNEQYERFLNAKDYSEASVWRGFPKYNEDCIQIGRWHDDGWAWFQEQMKDPGKFLDNKRIYPVRWDDENFGISSPDNPVVGVSWYEANAYCNWLKKHWSKSIEGHTNSGLRVKQIRLPLETEWVEAAGGEIPAGRYPWDLPGRVTKNEKEITRFVNIPASNVGHTTPANAYIRGKSPYGVMDMAGNVYEWQANFYDENHNSIAERGGSWLHYETFDGVADRLHDYPQNEGSLLGFRVVLLTKKLTIKSFNTYNFR